MELKQVIESLDLTLQSGAKALEVEVTGGYVSDLLSDVIANSQKGNLWITLQVHQNILAVATLKELAGIIMIGGKSPAEDTVKKATEEGIALMTTPRSAYETAGLLFELGVRGST